jgi:hypothetical protein
LIPTLPFVAGPQKWRLDFSGWETLGLKQRALLLIAIGDCNGEWWGSGRAEFATSEDAMKAAGRAVGLQIAAPRLTAMK